MMTLPSPYYFLLNGLVLSELTLADQYQLHSRLYQKWGLASLAAQFKDEAEIKITQAQDLSDQLKTTDNDTFTDQIYTLPIGSTITACFTLDLEMEKSVNALYQQLIESHTQKSEQKFLQLLNDGLEESSHQIEFLGQQLDLINQNGIQAYLKNELSAFNSWSMSMNAG